MSADVLGVLIARASGQPFGTFLRERIFGPLGMTDTGFSVPAGDLGRLPAEYATDFATGKTIIFDQPNGMWSYPPAFPSGAAGLVAIIDDYFAFARMLGNGGSYRGTRILSRPAVELMTADHLTPSQKAVSGLCRATSTTWAGVRRQRRHPPDRSGQVRGHARLERRARHHVVQ